MVTLAFPVASNVIVWFAPPSTVYVTTAFGVPVKLITAVEPEQIVVEPEIDAVGKAVTVTVALAVCAWLQIGVAVVVTLTKAYVEFTVNTGVVTLAFPEASNVTVWLAPPSTVYVTTAFGVPVKLTVPVVPEQIVFAVTLAVGKALTVIVTLPLAVLLQTGVVALATLTKV